MSKKQMRKVVVYRNYEDTIPCVTLQSEELEFYFLQFPQAMIFIALQGSDTEDLREELLKIVHEKWGVA